MALVSNQNTTFLMNDPTIITRDKIQYSSTSNSGSSSSSSSSPSILNGAAITSIFDMGGAAIAFVGGSCGLS